MTEPKNPEAREARGEEPFGRNKWKGGERVVCGSDRVPGEVVRPVIYWGRQAALVKQDDGQERYWHQDTICLENPLETP